MYARAAQSQRKSAQWAGVFQYFAVPSECAGNAGQRLAPIVLWPRDVEFRSRAAEVFQFSESKALQFRLETFNTFNHAQFFGPAAVNGDIDSDLFGQVVKAAPPREAQIAIKFIF